MLTTERLMIRNFDSSKKDLKALYGIMSDVEVNKYLPWFPLKNLQETEVFYKEKISKKYKENNGLYLAICLKDHNIPIGYVTVSEDPSHDFGYGLLREYWGQGIVTEATEAVLEFLRASNWNFITATHDVNNMASGKVMEKLQMKYEYSYKEQWQPKDILVTFRMYQLNFKPGIPVYKGYWDLYNEHFIEKDL